MNQFSMHINHSNYGRLDRLTSAEIGRCFRKSWTSFFLTVSVSTERPGTLPQGYRTAHSISALFSERFVSLLQNLKLSDALHREERRREETDSRLAAVSAVQIL